MIRPRVASLVNDYQYNFNSTHVNQLIIFPTPPLARAKAPEMRRVGAEAD